MQAAKTRLDGWFVRKEFLDLDPEDVPAVLDFLNQTGMFVNAPTGKEFTCPANPEELRQFQSLVRLYLISDPAEWRGMGKGFPGKLLHYMKWRGLPHFRMDWSGEAPTAVISAGFTFRALMATIQIDKWRQAKHRKCARPECETVFPIQGGRFNKIYCDHICGQYQAIRGYRKRNALKKKAGKLAGVEPNEIEGS